MVAMSIGYHILPLISTEANIYPPTHPLTPDGVYEVEVVSWSVKACNHKPCMPYAHPFAHKFRQPR
jgi:hypothetical protein